MSLEVRSFGKYLLDEEIARGGMSRVFSARLRGLGGFEKRLVVKQVLPELASDPRFVSMFVHEAKTLVQMSHPHIAPVYELGVVDGVYFLAMEYVDGATLGAMLKDGPLPPGMVAHFGAEICDALHYAHSRFAIVHRDVTPRNVIVDSAGHSRLLDFGIATPLGDVGEQLFGTPGYLPPEQLHGDRIGPASDVFALGAVLFEALTGRRAFDAQTVEETRIALDADGPSFEEGEAPRVLAEIVMRALERDPDDRHSSARELGRALRGWLASVHPEGMGPELGTRAERAIDRGSSPARTLDAAPALNTPREVKTLATSKLLDRIIEGEADDLAGDSGTQRIEGRRSIPTPESAEPSSAPHTAEPIAQRERSPAKALWAIAAIAAVAIGLVFWSPWSSPPTPERSPRADRAPRERIPIERIEQEQHIQPVIEREAPAIEPQVEPPVVAALPGTLTINASPWAEVRLDGRLIGRTPQRRVSVRAGRHTILLSCPPLGRTVEHRFEVRAGGALTVLGDLSSDPPTIRVR